MRNGLSEKEAGKLGGEASREIQKIQKEERIRKYYQNPDRCLYCNEIISYERRGSKFCNSSHAASYNNTKRNKKPRKTYICLNCGKETKNHKFCNTFCQNEYEYKEYIRKWKNDEVDGRAGEYGISGHIRRYLLEKHNYRCSVCGWGEENKYSHKIPLEIHHINGNHLNNKEENLQILCPNCHSLTENYKSMNKLGGRPGRKKYYSKE